MKNVFAATAAFALLCLGGLAQANVTIETVGVGNAGNAADTRVMNDGTRGYGSVGYSYNIGKYEVTAGQYTAFLNAKANVSNTYGLYNANMWTDTTYGCQIQRSGSAGSYSYSVASAYANKPVNYVSYWDACRFSNWLGNGQGSGSTETGAYTLGGYTGIDGRNIRRNYGWTWAVASENEWYKAAYYKGSGVYSLYANGTGTAPVAGTACNYDGAIGHVWDGTVDGALEQNGTKDMMGNVVEWNEAVTYINGNYAYRGTRGGSFSQQDSYYLGEQCRGGFSPAVEGYNIGFRVSFVPEPSSLIALLGGLAGLLAMRRRRA